MLGESKNGLWSIDGSSFLCQEIAAHIEGIDHGAEQRDADNEGKHDAIDGISYEWNDIKGVAILMIFFFCFF